MDPNAPLQNQPPVPQQPAVPLPQPPQQQVVPPPAPQTQQQDAPPAGPWAMSTRRAPGEPSLAPQYQYAQRPQYPIPQAPIVVKKSHARIITAIVIILLLALSGSAGFYYYQHRTLTLVQMVSNLKKTATSLFTKKYSPDDIMAEIRDNIMPSVVQIRCASEEGGEESQLGAGVYMHDASNTPIVATNAHVLLGPDGQYHGCNVYFPNPSDGSFGESVYQGGYPYLFHDQKSMIDGKEIDGLDYALLPIIAAGTDSTGQSYPYPPQKTDVFDILTKICSKADSRINVGDTLYVIGYPNTGGDSLTLTQGIVSGYGGDSDEYIKVSAVTNHGNSGGIAIGAKDGCEYGVPTMATFEPGANLGILLSTSFVSSFLDGLTGKNTYAPVATSTDAASYLTQSYEFPDFAIPVPAEWQANKTAPDSSGAYTVFFVSPLESAVDTVQDGYRVDVSPNSTTKDYKARLAILKQIAAAADTDAASKVGEVTLSGGQKAYSQSFIDLGGSISGNPEGYLQILFLRNGTMYQIGGFEEIPGRSAYFTQMISDAIVNIKFK